MLKEYRISNTDSVNEAIGLRIIMNKKTWYHENHYDQCSDQIMLVRTDKKQVPMPMI